METLRKLKSFIIGKPLKSSDIHKEKYTVLTGLPILSSDAISSVAYACGQILWVFIPVLGVLSFKYLMYVTLLILLLLSILVFSYKQTIENYPKGGGSYIVSKENLGELPSLLAGSALTIDYILTVAVSTTAGVAAITSAFPSLLRFNVHIALLIILIMTLGNLRGIRDSSKIFGLPTYLFIIVSIIMIFYGLIKWYVLKITPTINANMPRQIETLSVFLFLKAFSSGCTALTGIEAISDGVANFKEPSTKHAKGVLYLLFLIVIILFGGVSWLATLYHPVPTLDKTALSQIAEVIFGNNSIMFFVMQFSTTFILTIAANTAFSDFPLLLSFISRDGYAPRQFSKRGDRLSFSNGIILLAISATILIVVFNGDNHALIPLYAVGVFISFTLSQTGMVFKWCREKKGIWKHKAFINGFGAITTFITTIVISINKFKGGAWIVFILIPTIILLMKRTKAHYNKVENQLSLDNNNLKRLKEDLVKKIIIPVDNLNAAIIRTIDYTTYMSNDVMAIHMSVDEEETKALQNKWKELNISIPLIIKPCEYRQIVETLVDTIDSEVFKVNEKEMIAVAIPHIKSRTLWQNFLDNQTAKFIRKLLLKRRNIVVLAIPFMIDD
ncbi:APC family permease [Clostridium tarantellae]|uniref:Amino acid permease n=1 Tax=Clostridium tarantellae TaxID=39493 RepID=A0A6I1MSQ7_9CLOT|nr:APC family permease [Clostridium tarantellae]MPQ43921.1 amino acid permease [Clostridium tarantellae]